MSHDDKNDYSDYIKHLSNLGSGLLFISGFMFTVITILLTQLPNLNSPQSQLTLFFFSVIFNLATFLAFFVTMEGIYYCRRIPPLSKRRAIINMLNLLVTVMIGLTVTLLFLLWNLTFLVITSGIVWMGFVISGFFFVWKPFTEYRKKFRSKKS